MVRAIEGQGLRMTRRPPLPGSTGVPSFETTSGHDAEEGAGGGAGLGGDGAGDGSDHDGTGLGLPPGVDDGAALLADHAVIPHPGLGVDGFADGAEEAKRGERVPKDELVSPLDEGANGGGRGVEDGDLVVVDELPEAGVVGEVGRAFVHEDGGAVLQRAVDDVGVAGDPADVGGAEVDVVVAEIEDVFRREEGLDGVAAGGVDEALGLAGGSGGVKDVERVFGAHRLAGAGRRSTSARASSSHRSRPSVMECVGAGAAMDEDVFRTEGQEVRASSTMDLSLTSEPRRITAVLSEDCDAGGVVDAVGYGVGGESAEDDGVDGSDAGAGEQRDGELGTHAHVNGDAVAFADAEGPSEDVGEALDLFVKVEVSKTYDLTGLALPDEGGLIGAGTEGVPVDAVMAKVEAASVEPGGRAHLALKDRGERGQPVEVGCGFGPEGSGIFHAAAVERLVLGERRDVGHGGELGWRGEDAVLAEQRVHVLRRVERGGLRFG